jgi:hypothetical protein
VTTLARRASLVAVLAGGLVLHRRRFGPAPDPAVAAAALSEVLDDSLDDLRRESDPRRAVIAAYARMEQTLAAYGLPRLVFETPTEYLTRVLVELHATAGSARRLTALFERAKFSHHAVPVGMKDEAIAALVELRDELRPQAVAA